MVAVQYRRIRFRFFFSRHIEQKHLDFRTTWKYAWNMRGPENPDLMEVSLAYEDADDEDDDVEEMLDENSEGDV